MSAVEKARIERWRKTQETTRHARTSDGVSAFVPDDFLHFCGENVLVFGGLERLGPRVAEWRPEDANSQLNAVLNDFLDSQEDSQKDVLIDVSKIPAPRARRSSTATESRSFFSLLPLQPPQISFKKRARPQRTWQGVRARRRPSISEGSRTCWQGPALNLQETPFALEKNPETPQFTLNTSASSSASQSSEGICADFLANGPGE